MSSSHVRCKCGHSEASSAPHCWNDQVQEGEVRAALFTSIHLPLLESVIDRLPSVSKYTLSVCARLRGGRCGKPRRPCIVYDVKTSDVCLMGTFEGCDPGRFPEVYRRFVVPVYPNLGKTPSDLHVHSCPRWESHHNQWILLVPFKPLVEDFQELPSWSSRKMTSRVHFDSEAMEVLRSLCREKQEEWEAEIHDKPTSLNQAHKEILNATRSRVSTRRSTNTRMRPSSSASCNSPNGLLSFRRGVKSTFGDASQISENCRRSTSIAAKTCSRNPMTGHRKKAFSPFAPVIPSSLSRSFTNRFAGLSLREDTEDGEWKIPAAGER